MNLDELKQAWKSEETRMTVHTVMLLDSVRKKQARLQWHLWLHDLREGWGSILAALLFVFTAESDAKPSELWLFYLAMCILFGIGVFRIINRWRQNQRRPQYNDASLGFINDSLFRLNHRIWLLEQMLWWWVIPVTVIIALVVIQIGALVGWREPTLYLKLIPGILIASVVIGIVYFGNKWSLRKYLKPQRDELQGLANSLKTP